MKPGVTEGAQQTFSFLVSAEPCKYDCWPSSGINHKLDTVCAGINYSILPPVTTLIHCFVKLHGFAVCEFANSDNKLQNIRSTWSMTEEKAEHCTREREENEQT